jgi:hypothetical protein
VRAYGKSARTYCCIAASAIGRQAWRSTPGVLTNRFDDGKRSAPNIQPNKLVSVGAGDDCGVIKDRVSIRLPRSIPSCAAATVFTIGQKPYVICSKIDGAVDFSAFVTGRAVFGKLYQAEFD